MNFNELNLRPQIQRAIAEFGYTTPSPIQQKAIPPVLEGHDLIGCAQTGTGKTAAFALPMLELLARGKRAKSGEIRALILTPTRELALQIGQNFTDYGKHTGLRHAVIFGGVGQMPQVAAIKRGLDVLIACPGRLNDLSNQGFVDLSKLEIFVLDEADRMLDMGFVHDVKRVVARLPKQRQNLMFSATMPKEIEALASTFLTKPVMVKVNPVSSTVEKIEQSLYFVEKGNKLALLIHLLKSLQIGNALVFSRTKHGADKIVKQLEKAGITAAAIHGNKGQNARVTALENFKAGKTKVLVATDIAARGIDINELSHVFNYDLPEVPETYVHRIGRTARAGADGIAISFCASEEKEYLLGIEKLNRKQIPVVADHPWAGKASPVKSIVAPLRGRKPANADAAAASQVKSAKSAKLANGRGNGKQPRNIDNAAGNAPAPRQQEERQMNDNNNRGNGRNQNAPQGGRDGQPRQGQGGRNGNGRDHRGNRGAAPAQPKFDPRFLSPQQAAPAAHSGAANRAPEPEMLDVRRMNQAQAQPQGGRNDRNARNNRGGRDNRDNRNGGGRDANSRDNRGANNRDNRGGDARDSRGGNGNNRDNTRDNRGADGRGGNNNNRDNRSAPRGAAPAPQGGRAPQNAGGNRGAQPARDNRGGNGNSRDARNGGDGYGRDNRNNGNSRDNRDNRNANSRDNRDNRSDARDSRGGNSRDNRNNNRNDYAPRGGQSTNRTAGKVGHGGLKTVRSSHAAPTNSNDPGLVLITKKPPQQKFTTFDAYMSAHGGATAPVDEFGDK